MSTNKIAELTGLSPETVDKIVDAHYGFMLAIGLVHGEEEGAARAEALRKKYPDLLGATAEAAGKPGKPVSFELEARIVQLESGEPPKAVTDVLAAYNEVYGLVDPPFTEQYRRWAKGWTSR